MSIHKAVPLFLVAAIGVGWFAFTREERTRLTFLAVGQGDCAVFRHQGRTVLIDAGPALKNYDAGERIVKPRLRAMGIDRVDLLLLTHPDLDHVGGAGAILRAFPMARLGMSSAFRENRAMKEHLRAWGLPSSQVLWLPPRAKLTIGDFVFRLYAAPRTAGEEANEGSLFARITGRGASAVLTGDAPASDERIALGEGDWSAQVLKAGHHGSRTATTTEFLKGVRPEWLVVSCGRDNRYGHPAAEVLRRAAEAKVLVARTDFEGEIAFEVRQGRFERVR